MPVARARRLIATVALVMAAVGVAGPAVAHPGGTLPHATLSADGEVVTIEWSAAPDDAADVGAAVGLLPDEAMRAYLGDADVYLPTDEEIATLSQSAALRSYLLDNIQVRQDGHPCASEATPGANFIVEGATLTFTCPSPVDEVLIRITMLHDRDTAYRTFSVDGTIQYAVHTSSSPEHVWDFTATVSGTSPPVPLGLIVAGALVLVAGAASLLVVRTQRRPNPRHARQSKPARA